MVKFFVEKIILWKFGKIRKSGKTYKIQTNFKKSGQSVETQTIPNPDLFLLRYIEIRRNFCFEHIYWVFWKNKVPNILMKN